MKTYRAFVRTEEGYQTGYVEADNLRAALDKVEAYWGANCEIQSISEEDAHVIGNA